MGNTHTKISKNDGVAKKQARIVASKSARITASNKSSKPSITTAKTISKRDHFPLLVDTEGIGKILNVGHSPSSATASLSPNSAMSTGEFLADAENSFHGPKDGKVKDDGLGHKKSEASENTSKLPSSSSTTSAELPAPKSTEFAGGTSGNLGRGFDNSNNDGSMDGSEKDESPSKTDNGHTNEDVPSVESCMDSPTMSTVFGIGAGLANATCAFPGAQHYGNFVTGGLVIGGQVLTSRQFNKIGEKLNDLPLVKSDLDICLDQQQKALDAIDGLTEKGTKHSEAIAELQKSHNILKEECHKNFNNLEKESHKNFNNLKEECHKNFNNLEEKLDILIEMKNTGRA